MTNDAKSPVRFLLFAGADYYPRGGYEDFVADSDDIAELKARFGTLRPDEGVAGMWGQIVRQADGRILEVTDGDSRGYFWLPYDRGEWQAGWPGNDDPQRLVEVESRRGEREEGEVGDMDWSNPDEADKYSCLPENEIVRYRFIK